jgi:SAM-dependent methyltransferase
VQSNIVPRDHHAHRVRPMARVLLNLGCGDTGPKGWINADCSLNILAQKYRLLRPFARRILKSKVYESHNVAYMSLNRAWKFSSDSVDVVYASHVFEHLTQYAAELFLQEAIRVLKRNGVVRLVVPDLLALADQYVSAARNDDVAASSRFLYAINLHKENAYPRQRHYLYRIVNWLQNYPHQHKYMYDNLSLRKCLQVAGFKRVQQCGYGVSQHISEICDVECTGEGIPAIYFEAIKE